MCIDHIYFPFNGGSSSAHKFPCSCHTE